MNPYNNSLAAAAAIHQQQQQQQQQIQQQQHAGMLRQVPNYPTLQIPSPESIVSTPGPSATNTAATGNRSNLGSLTAIDTDQIKPVTVATGGTKRKAPSGAASGPDRSTNERSRAPREGSASAGGTGGGSEGENGSSGSGGNKRGKESKETKDNAPPLPRGSACQVCRKRKLRCDGTRPQCSTCTRLGHTCVYADPVHEKLQDRIRMLEAKVDSLEGELEGYHAKELMRMSSGTELRTPSSGGAGDQYPATTPLPIPAPPPAMGSGIPTYAQFQSPSSHPQQIPQQLQPYPQGTNQSSPHSIISGELNSPPYVSAPPDSQTFPFPSPHGSSNHVYGHHQHQNMQHYSMPPPHLQAPSVTSAPAVPPPTAPHLQSFPFMMQHPHSAPQLADLMNSPGTAGPMPQLHSVSTPSSAHPASPSWMSANNQNHVYQQQQPQQRQWQQGSDLTTTWGGDLPSLDVLLDLANIYFTTVHTHFPFLQRHRFLYSLNNPTSLSSPPSLSLIYAVLATAAPYSDAPSLRGSAADFYLRARDQVETAINVGAHGRGGRTVASLTVETVQALCLLTMIETANSDHQRAFLSIGQAVRVAAMLGLHRMDEDRIEEMSGSKKGARRLRPPALHALPTDPLLLEECRRTMCTVFVLDRFESATVGWPPAIAEVDIRVLLPCEDRLYDNGLCAPGDNPLWWPKSGDNTDAEDEDSIRHQQSSPGEARDGVHGEPALGRSQGAYSNGTGLGHGIGLGHEPLVDSFAWLVRVVWIGGRIQGETYRSSGRPAQGPWSSGLVAPVDDVNRVLEMDRTLEEMRLELNRRATSALSKGMHAPLVMSLLILNCNFLNLHHLRVSVGLKSIPFNPHVPVPLGSAEHSMTRCLEALRNLRDICAQLAVYENARTTLYGSRMTVFTSFVPHVLYCIVFPCKFALGDWALIAASRIRAENVPARVPTSAAAPQLPSGDDVFGQAMDDERLGLIEILIDAIDRVSVVWPIGRKFSAMLKGDKMRLAARIMERASNNSSRDKAAASALGAGAGNDAEAAATATSSNYA